ncbi:DUF5054 domain-containing protein [Gordoniibacillus kamchatkensis]|uniref:DUF5054 domain-containing protein n=1 Tax=Gordoniibacillus kamchatkensis TaxID=1590651 RepID=UPI000697DCE2|nr:DUF5054 domain-containing protein [Paenibacillus sp. VKM B-2647]
MKALETIYIVFKTHVDLGFTDLARNVVEQYSGRMMDEVLAACELTQSGDPDQLFVWTLPAWMLRTCLDSVPADKKRRLEALIRQGQLRWHGLPYTTHTEFCGTEEYVRGLYESERLRQRFGRETVAAKMTDVPGHTWMLPTLLKGAGIEFLHLGVNACSSPVDVPRLFYWEGPDGSRVLTYYSKGEYGTSLLPPGDWPYPVWMALLQTNDNHGPQNGEAVQRLLDEVKAHYPDTKVKIGTMDDFARDFLSRGFSDIPVVRKDLADTWIHGVGTYPAEVSAVRRLRPEIASRESLAALERLQGTAEAYPAEPIRKAYEQTLLFGEHTWGIDVKSVLLPGRNSTRAFYKKDVEQDRRLFPASYRKAEQSWSEQSGYLEAAAAALSEVRPYAAQGSSVIGVYNPLGWTRRDAEIVLAGRASGILRDRSSGIAYPVGEDGTVRIGDVPALGYRTFAYDEAAAAGDAAAAPIGRQSGDQAVLENSWLRITVDAGSGAVTSFYDKACGKEWASERGFAAYEYDVYGKDDVNGFVKAYAYDLTDWYVNDFGKPGYPRISHRQYGATLERIEIANIGVSGSIRLSFGVPPESCETFGNAQASRSKLRCTATAGTPISP